jgi:hypothetical protein
MVTRAFLTLQSCNLLLKKLGKNPQGLISVCAIPCALCTTAALEDIADY